HLSREVAAARDASRPVQQLPQPRARAVVPRQRLHDAPSGTWPFGTAPRGPPGRRIGRRGTRAPRTPPPSPGAPATGDNVVRTGPFGGDLDGSHKRTNFSALRNPVST